MVAAEALMQQLELVNEAKIFGILADRLDPKLEASGVLVKDGLFYVIFDNLPHIALIDPRAVRGGRGQRCDRCRRRGHDSGFEDIAYDARGGRFYVLIESLPRDGGRTWPRCRSTTPASAT
jgi:hypothetical protein